jgi:DNA-binding SARP family transcriptional activator
LALQCLGQHCAAQEELNEAIRYYQRIVEKDSYQEGAYREIMRCQALLGQRGAALKSYHRLAELLEKELDAEPSPETTALYEQILKGSAGPV